MILKGEIGKDRKVNEEVIRERSDKGDRLGRLVREEEII